MLFEILLLFGELNYEIYRSLKCSRVKLKNYRSFLSLFLRNIRKLIKKKNSNNFFPNLTNCIIIKFCMLFGPYNLIHSKIKLFFAYLCL